MTKENKDRKLCIDVRGFSDDKKKRVQDAFFKLGYEWGINDKAYRYLEKEGYSNFNLRGILMEWLRCTPNISAPLNQKHLVSYEELMEIAGMPEKLHKTRSWWCSLDHCSEEEAIEYMKYAVSKGANNYDDYNYNEEDDEFGTDYENHCSFWDVCVTNEVSVELLPFQIKHYIDTGEILESPKKEQEYLNDKVYMDSVKDWGLPDGSVLTCIEDNGAWFSSGNTYEINKGGLETYHLLSTTSKFRLTSIPEGYTLNGDGTASKIEEKPEYGYMVEYPTNGEKPALPDDVLVEVKTKFGDWVRYDSDWDQVSEWAWENVTHFKIYDERYAPKGHTQEVHPEEPIKVLWDGKSPLEVGMTVSLSGSEVTLKLHSEISGWVVEHLDGSISIKNTCQLSPVDTRTPEQKCQDAFSDYLDNVKTRDRTDFVDAVKSGTFPNVIWKEEA